MAPPDRTGELGTHRVTQSECRIKALTDRDAIVAWLADVAACESSYMSLRSAAEKLLNWACFQRGIALSSIEPDDLVAFIAFLSAPGPSDDWICPRATKRSSSKWRPFQSALCAKTQSTVVRAIGALFIWLREMGYAYLPLVADQRSLRLGSSRQSVCATQNSRLKHQPLTPVAWHWVERRLADTGRPPTLATSLVLELLYFGGLKLVDIEGLKEGHCMAPTSNCPTWRIFLRSRPAENPWVYALPPLARSLDEWFGPQTSMLRPKHHDFKAVSWEGEPVFNGCPSLFKLVTRLLRQAGAMATAQGDHASSRELTIATPLNLRYAIETHGEADPDFARGFVAHSRFNGGSAIEYVYPKTFTHSSILLAWDRLSHLWSKYPCRETHVQQPRVDTVTPVTRITRTGPIHFSFPSGLTVDSKTKRQWSQIRIDSGAAIDAYRAMDRYIRTHVAPRCHSTLCEWIECADPKLISSALRESVKYQAIWTYLLWAFTVEPTIRRRRWRVFFLFGRHNWSVQLTIPVPRDLLSRDSRNVPSEHTVLQQTGDTLLAVWHSASNTSRMAAGSGRVSWGPGTVQLKLDASGEKIDDLQVSKLDRLTALPSISKADRVHVYAQRDLARRQQLAKICEGPCLTYSGISGWSVVSVHSGSCFALKGDMRRARLLGVKGRPDVLLYLNQGQYVARLTAVALQVVGSSPQVCFVKLREACHLYERCYGTPWLVDDRPVVSTRQNREDPDDFAFRGKVESIASRGKFWENGAQISFAWKMHEQKHRGVTPD